jgi:MoxR-like ATPase
MEERQVTIGDTTFKCDAPFLVLATQNPVEQEGTYPLPEAQMDRFLMHVAIDYPDTTSEIAILRLNRQEDAMQKTDVVISPEVVFDARKEIQKVTISEPMEQYIVDIVAASRTPEKYDEELAKWIRFGASPRGSIAIDKAARTHAWMNNQSTVGVDNIRAVVHDCLRHRLGLSYEAAIQQVSADQVIDKLLTFVAVLA